MSSRTTTRRVLVASSYRDTLEAVKHILREEGFVVDAVDTGADVLKKVRQHHPAAVLLDLADAGDESSLVTRCHQESGCEAIPILVMAPTPCAAIAAIRVGAQGYVRTPVERATLVPMLWQVQALSRSGSGPGFGGTDASDRADVASTLTRSRCAPPALSGA
jgi:CheY-like chemotaxis protein